MSIPEMAFLWAVKKMGKLRTIPGIGSSLDFEGGSCS